MFSVLATALIMIVAVMPLAVDEYQKFIEKLVRTHGRECSAAIYQAEARMRRERMARIRREASGHYRKPSP